MLKKLLYLSAVGLIFLSSCKKPVVVPPGNDPTNPDVSGKSKREIFKMQPWRMAEWLDSQENKTVWTDDIDACMKDDVYTFKAGDKASVNEGADDCYPSQDNTYEVPWLMPSDNASTVTLLGHTWDILKQTNTEIVLWTLWNSGSEQHYKKLTFKRN